MSKNNLVTDTDAHPLDARMFTETSIINNRRQPVVSADAGNFVYAR